MVAEGKDEAVRARSEAEYDRLSELKAFDETKAGVKGLVDAGVTEVPRIFHKQSDDHSEHSSVSGDHVELSIPVIDLGGLVAKDSAPQRAEIVERVREASEKWGFFQIVNHGISESVLEEIKDGVRRFHEQETEAKKAFYSRDPAKLVAYNSNFDLYSGSFTNWRDTFFYTTAPNPPNPHDLPSECR